MTDFQADLHMHTTASDGVKSSTAMMALANKAGMAVVAVTDHDTVSGIDEALTSGSALGLHVIPGLELSTGDHEEIHLLAYGMRADNPMLQGMLAQSIKERYERMLEILKKLSALHMDITPEEACNDKLAFTGRMHLAQAMVSHGYVSSVREAFDKYLGMNRCAFVPRKRVRVLDAIERLRSFQCVVSLAHPGRLLMSAEELALRLPGWVEAGLSAMEVYHPSHSYADVRYFREIARRHGLLMTGGSDCHGRSAHGSAQIGDHMRLWRSVKEDTEALVERIAAVHSGFSAPIQPGAQKMPGISSTAN